MSAPVRPGEGGTDTEPAKAPDPAGLNPRTAGARSHAASTGDQSRPPAEISAAKTPPRNRRGAPALLTAGLVAALVVLGLLSVRIGARGQEAALRRNLLGVIVEESIYNLMERTVELEVLPACRAYGIGVMPYSPLNSGLLGGVLAKDETAARTASKRAADGLSRGRRQIERYEQLCRDIGQPPAVVAQSWLLHQPGVTAPVVGVRTMRHLEDGIRAANLSLSEGELAELDGIFPGPGAAPEAYAW